MHHKPKNCIVADPQPSTFIWSVLLYAAWFESAFQQELGVRDMRPLASSTVTLTPWDALCRPDRSIKSPMTSSIADKERRAERDNNDAEGKVKTERVQTTIDERRFCSSDMRCRGRCEFTRSAQMQSMYVLSPGTSEGFWASLRHRRSSVHDASID